MAQETLKLVITADTQEALDNLQNFIKTSQGLKGEMQNFGKVGNQATNALTNLSRVAQDAPYGFIGIANNLNPLLESFQRLQAEAGGTGAALKSMAQGLMGPAGIGLALGAVSSLLVAFGPQIANFIKGVDAAKQAEDKFAQSLDKAKASASESGIKLQAYIGIAEDATIADDKRANALRFVIAELAKVNSAYASTIKTTDQARAAVDLYTQALISQAITSRYVDEIADKTIKLADANKRALLAADEYNKTIERSKTLTNGYADASIVQAGTIDKARQNYKEAAQEAVSLNGSIISLNKSLTDTVRTGATNPFNAVTNGISKLKGETKTASNDVNKLVRDYGAIPKHKRQQLGIERPSLMLAQQTSVLGKKATLEGDDWAQQQMYDLTKLQNQEQEQFNDNLILTRDIVGNLAPAFETVFSAMVMGDDVGKALEATFKQILVQLISMVTQALLFKTILGALTGGTSAFGEAAAGAVGFGGGLGGFFGEFLLRGSDLVLATQRANNNLNLRR
jgi:hypothetical protein